MPSSDPAARPPSAYLVIDQGGRWADLYRLDRRQAVVLGRSSECQIVIRTDGASRKHAEIRFDQHSQQWCVKDLGSRNGTFVDGKKIESSVPIAENQTITVANFAVRFTTKLSTSQAEKSKSFPPAGSQATIELDPNSIQSRIEHSGLLRQDDQNESRADRASLLRLSFAVARGQTMGEIIDAVVSYLRDRANGSVSIIRSPEKIFGDGDDDAIAAASAFASGAFGSPHQAVLARNVAGGGIGSQNSLGNIAADQIIIAPVQPPVSDGINPSPWGVIVVTAGVDADRWTPADLQTVVAAAEILAVRLSTMTQTRQLTKTLEQTRQQLHWLRQTIGEKVELIGRSESIAGVIQQIRLVAATTSTVLIRGESGVGKALVAAAIHHASDRSEGPLVTLNCAAISPPRMELELFGNLDSRGKFAAAHRGTLVLDEIGEMSIETQTKVLRVIETGFFDNDPLGKAKPIDVRVIASTHRDLQAMVDAGEFRQDLFYRLHVVEIVVPPLRDRIDDVIVLARHFIDHFARTIGRPTRDLTDAAIQTLQRYDWPGNVRELRNVIERAVVLTNHATLDRDDLHLTHAGKPASTNHEPAIEITLDQLERQHVARVLEYTEQNKTRAATILGIERSTLDRKLKRWSKQIEPTA